jgi:hypothetical protein
MERFHSPSENPPARTGFQTPLIPLALCLCLIVLFIGVWNHVKESEQPPLFDAISYMVKAKAFWDMVASGHWKNPLNLQPILRPPGTILMSYPFGFSEDYKGFLARSIILPVLVFVAALYVAASRKKMSRAEHLDLLAIALILASLPCFYHFEAAGGPVFWGLVDNFFAAVAAFALAIGYRSVRKRSWSLLVLASLTTGFCLMIKPAGTIVAVIIIFVLTALMFTEELFASDDMLSAARVFRFISSFRLFSFLITVSLGTGLFFVASIKSDYLSGDTIQYGNTAIKIVHDAFAGALSAENFKNCLYPSFGLNVIVLGFTTAVAVVWTFARNIRPRVSRWALATLAKPLLAASVLAVGCFFWLAYANLSNVRYFYPFAFVSLILMAIFLLDAIRGRAAPYTRLLIYGSSVILFGSLTVMLHFSQLDSSWQRKFGLNLESSSGREGKRLSDLLIRRAKAEERNLNVYCLGLGWDFALAQIGCWGQTETVLHPTEPAFTYKDPVDWIHTSVVHLEDLFSSDYILYHPVSGAASLNVARGLKIDNLLEEVETISFWLTTANEQCGLKDLELGTIAIKKVVSPKLFAQALAKWAASRNWRDVFKIENSDFLENTDSTMLHSEKAQSAPAVSTETFEQAIAIDDVAIETASPLVFRVNWHALAENLPDKLYFFVHVIDGRSKVLENCAFDLNSRLWVDSSPLVFHHTLVPSNIHVASGILRYGFGIYEGTHAEKLLMPNPAGNALGGKRVDRETQVQ